MIDIAALRVMVAAGMSASAIVDVIEADRKADVEKAAAKREDARQRQIKSRATKKLKEINNSVTNVTVTECDTCDTPSQVPPSDGFPSTPSLPITTPSSPSPHSDPNGSDADAASRDPRTRLFRHGLASLKRITGRGEDSCRSLIGKWLKAAADSAIDVLAAIEDAERNEVANAPAWIAARLASGPRAPPAALSPEDEDLPVWAQKATPEFKQRYRESEKARKAANGQPPETPN